MVELPRYVKARTKPNGRVFHHYERHRGTPRAWPRLDLRFGPTTPEFWARCCQCESLDAQRSPDGTWAWRWIGPSGRSYDLPEPKGAIEAFWKAIGAAETAERNAEAGVHKTFRALIAEYKAHHAWTTAIGDSTRKFYQPYLDTVLEVWGDDPVRNLLPQDAQAAIDSFQEHPPTANHFRGFLSRVVAFGIPRGYCLSNPVEHTEKVGHEAKPYKPWPDWAFELFFEHARVGLYLPVYSAIYTGQRASDVVPMVRPRRDADAVELVARKTGGNVWVPIHSEYREVLEAVRADHVRLHLREDGEAWTLAAYRTAWQRELTFSVADDDETATAADREKAAAMRRLREFGLVFHGLRKNAVCMLVEAGCSYAQVAAIVEMSEAMVAHYAKDVEKRRLAVAGMRRLEEGWKQTRELLFGKAADRMHGNGR